MLVSNRHVTVAFILTLLAGLFLPADGGETLSSRELLKAVRQRGGRSQKLAYEDRSVVLAGPSQGGLAKQPLADPNADSGRDENSDELLQRVPADCLLCIRVNNLDYTLGQIDEFLVGIAPMPKATSILVRAQLAKLLGSAQLNGVKTTGSFVVFVAAKSTDTAKLKVIPGLLTASLVPVSDYGQFVEGNPNVSEPDANGVSRITAEGMPALLAVEAGSFALITSDDNYNWLLEYKKLMAPEVGVSSSTSLAGNIESGAIRDALAEPVWVYCDMQRTSESFSFFVLGSLKALQMQFKAAQAKGAPARMEMAAPVMDMYMHMAGTLMKEISWLSLTLDPKPDLVKVRLQVKAVDSTSIAEALREGPSSGQQNKLLAYLEEGAALNIAGKMDAPLLRRLSNFGIEMMTKLAGPDVAAEKKDQIKALFDDLFDSMGPFFAVSVTIEPRNQPPFSAHYVFEVTDQVKFNSALVEYIKLWNDPAGPASFYNKMGIQTQFSLKNNIGNYKGVPINATEFTVRPTDPNSPEAAMITRMYGDGFAYRWAIVDRLSVGTCGGTETELRRLIDLVQAGGPRQLGGQTKRTLELLPSTSDADFLVILNPVRLLKLLSVFGVENVTEAEMPASGGIPISAKAEKRKLLVDIALPKAVLTETLSALRKSEKVERQNKAERKGPAAAKIDSGVVRGKIKGTEVVLDKAELEGNILSVYSGDSWDSNPSILLFVFDIKRGTIPDNRSFSMEPGGAVSSMIHVHYRWKDPASGKIQTAVETRGYRLHLQFGQRNRETIPGTILLEIPDKDTKLEGSFNARIKTTTQVNRARSTESRKPVSTFIGGTSFEQGASEPGPVDRIQKTSKYLYRRYQL